jgi:hypothetical protein
VLVLAIALQCVISIAGMCCSINAYVMKLNEHGTMPVIVVVNLAQDRFVTLIRVQLSRLLQPLQFD